MLYSLLLAAAATGFTFACTALGAAAVFLIRDRAAGAANTLFLGFAAGVMIAASVWSLLMPSIEQTEAAGGIGWIPAAGGFAIGAAFLMVIHALLPHLNPGKRHAEGLPAKWHRSTLLFTAVTLHNIPEGMSVGLLFGMAGQNAGDPALMGMATALALGIGIQNIPRAPPYRCPWWMRACRAGRHFLWALCPAWPSPCSAALWCLPSAPSRRSCRGCWLSQPAP